MEEQHNKALVIEDDAVSSTILQDHGYHITVFHPRSVNTATMSNITIQLKSGLFKLVWIDLPSSGRTVPPGKRPAIIRVWERRDVKAVLKLLKGFGQLFASGRPELGWLEDMSTRAVLYEAS